LYKNQLKFYKNKRNFSEFDIRNNDNRVFKGACKSCNKSLKFKLKAENNGLLERDNISFLLNGKQYTGLRNTFEKFHYSNFLILTDLFNFKSAK
jgi:hypothetical protein